MGFVETTAVIIWSRAFHPPWKCRDQDNVSRSGTILLCSASAMLLK
jgi:hypothetical protein